VKKGGALPSDETIRLGISTFQTLLATDFRADEIEVGVISAVRANGRFTVLPTTEVEAHLAALAERD
jgi:20S proteasome subunit alpha 1